MLWKFGLGSYSRSKIHWCLALQSAVMWIKTACCIESSDHRACRRVVLMTLRSTMFWFTEPRIAAPNTNGSLIWNNFQDQTSTATVGISPKNMGKMPQNLLKKVFWKINFIKMIKIFVCEENLTETIGWGYNCHFYFPSFWMPWVQTISWKSSLAWKKMEQFSKQVWKENTFVRLDDR